MAVDDGAIDATPGFLDRLRRGDSAAFETLVTTHQHRVFGVALRMLGSRADAEDVAQETFLRAHRALPEFRGDAKLSTWLYAIAARLCLSRLGGSQRRLVRADEEILARIPDGGADPGRVMEEEERGAALRRAITELSEERRMVVVLRDLEGLAYEEIAEVLGIELGTVRSRLHRARLDLREKLERFLP
jgi:RNA polymerase sigma-70 factor (ECF subfamily)